MELDRCKGNSSVARLLVGTSTYQHASDLPLPEKPGDDSPASMTCEAVSSVHLARVARQGFTLSAERESFSLFSDLQGLQLKPILNERAKAGPGRPAASGSPVA